MSDCTLKDVLKKPSDAKGRNDLFAFLRFYLSAVVSRVKLGKREEKFYVVKITQCLNSKTFAGRMTPFILQL